MEDETLTSLRYCFQRILVPTIVIVGLLGNFVTVIVLTRRRMKCSTNVYLFFLAIVDMVFLLFSFILTLAHYPHLNRAKYDLYWRLFGIFVWLVDGSSYSSIYLTVSFTIERYIAVCHPIRGQGLCTESRAKKVIAVVIILCFLLTSTTSFEYILESTEMYIDTRTGLPCNGTRTIWEANSSSSSTPAMDLSEHYNDTAFELEPMKQLLEERNHTGPSPFDQAESSFCVKDFLLKAVESELAKNNTYSTIVSYMAAIIFTFLPLILLATFNCFLVAAVHNSTKLRRDMTHSRKSQSAAVQENKMTVTLIAVVLLFLVCQTPTAIFLIYTSFVGVPGSKQVGNLWKAIGNILNCLVIINAACNFILYCALSAKYRQTVKDIIFRRGRMKRQNTAHTRLSRYVSGTDASSSRGGGGWQPSSRSSRTPSFQADVRQKWNSSSRTPSFIKAGASHLLPPPSSPGPSGGGSNSHRGSISTRPRAGQQSGDRNLTSSISEKRPSISVATDSNCLTESNRGDVNRQFSGCGALAVPQPTPSSGRHAKASSSPSSSGSPSPTPVSDAKKTKEEKSRSSSGSGNDTEKRSAAQHLLRNSHSSASLTRSQSLVFPEQTKHSPSCKSHPMNK